MSYSLWGNSSFGWLTPSSSFLRWLVWGVICVCESLHVWKCLYYYTGWTNGSMCNFIWKIIFPYLHCFLLFRIDMSTDGYSLWMVSSLRFTLSPCYSDVIQWLAWVCVCAFFFNQTGCLKVSFKLGLYIPWNLMCYFLNNIFPCVFICSVFWNSY